MILIPTITTPRLILRQWRDSDLLAFAALNMDERVMEFMPRRFDRAKSDARAAEIRGIIAERGWGFFAVEAPGVADFIGFIGLAEATFDAHFTPAVEIGWRLAFEHWGKGYASEGAGACLDFGFKQLGADEIVSFTVPQNVRSWRVMERIGMKHDPADDFDHSMLTSDHPLRRHVLYRLRRSDWNG